MRLATIVTAILFVTSCALAESAFFGEGGNPAADVAWLYETNITVYETIDYAGDGNWAYHYEFTNLDPDAIWSFGVFTTFNVVGIPSTWDGYFSWVREGGQIIYVFDAYDGRNLDPDIVYIAGTYGPGLDDTNVPIPPGESVAGFTIVAEVRDESPKWYFYETVASGYAGDTGYVAAVGLTQSPPVATDGDTLTRVRALFR